MHENEAKGWCLETRACRAAVGAAPFSALARVAAAVSARVTPERPADGDAVRVALRRAAAVPRRDLVRAARRMPARRRFRRRRLLLLRRRPLARDLVQLLRSPFGLALDARRD